MHDLILNINKLHTTDMGGERVRRNIGLGLDADVVAICRDMILSHTTQISRRGKNFYVTADGVIIVVNATSYTIITAHRT